MPAGDFDLRPIVEAEWDEFARATFLGFHEEVQADEVDVWRRLVHLDRTLAVFDGDRIVATAESMPWTMTVPYATPVRCAAVSSVTVTPTHRRQGLLRSMMLRMLHDLHSAGEPLAALFASEGAIYPRFGYGIAATHFDVTVDRDHSALRREVAVAGQVSYVELPEAVERLPAIYAAATGRRPGAMQRREAQWHARVVFDPGRNRGGYGPRQAVIARERGYALFRLKHGREGNAPQGVVKVEELLAVDADAEAILWSFLLGIDLMGRVEATNRPADDPLRYLLVDPAREVRSFAENFYVRIVDVPSALTSRGYEVTDNLVVEVTDPLCPWNNNTWRLDTEDVPSCVATDAAPDIRLHVTELGSVFLGGVRFTALADAGLIAERTEGGLARADRLFAGPRPPWNPTPF